MSNGTGTGGTGAGGATRLQNFAAMSAVLTGFQASVISPGLDPINLKQLYLDTADREVGPALVDQLIAQFLSLTGQPKQQIANALLATASPDPPPTALLAESIVKMWYLGNWYPATSPSTSGPPANGTVISSNAYIGGLAWQAAQAHPMGYSTYTFGYWKQAPPPLAQFGVDGDGGDGDGGGSNG